MGESLYHLLGVDRNADQASIRRAYRERVRDHHPDVSDDPDAVDEFKRLTAARDVLTDDDARARYDRLGHDAYVAAELEAGLWPDEAERSEPTENAAAAPDDTGGRHARGTASSSARERSSVQARVASASAPGATGFRGDTTSGRRNYRSAGDTMETGTAFGRVRASLTSLGPWLVVHAVFLATAAGAAGMVTASTGAITALSLPIGVGFFGLALFLSALHVVSVLYV
jgi:curved DNA-binding protein CbpA